MEKLLSLMEKSHKSIVFTGAGVSTLSGIRDFRGRGGFYTSDYEGLAVEDILSIDYFLRDPSIFYRWAREFLYTLDDFEPSVVHTVLAKLKSVVWLSLFILKISIYSTRKGGVKGCMRFTVAPLTTTV